jgi:enolase
MSKIKNIEAREIKDSRGNPTVEVELETEKGVFVASCPSGASTGKNEAKTVETQKAVENVNKIIAAKLKGKNPENQKEIDELMDKNLGANAVLPVSMAVCRAGAAANKLSLYQYIFNLSHSYASEGGSEKEAIKIPLAMFNILNGGRHAKNGLDIQEFMIIPQKKTFAENLILCSKIFENLRELIIKDFSKEHLELGDEGGFAPPIKTAEQALYLLKSVSAGLGVSFGIDCAASEFFKNGKYNLGGRELTRAELLGFYEELIKEFEIVSIEDPFSEEDWNGFEDIVRQLGNKITVVGDDLTTTNIKRIKEAHSKNACNGVILKLNQIGTVSETIEAAELAKSYGWKTIVSHRSGETMDDFIADLAVGLRADFLKAGSPAKPERMVKYNRLLEIENEIKKHG